MEREIARAVASERAFLGLSALLFAASVAVTIAWCRSMSAMGEMPMPGGWTMSMAWMRMPGQTWSGAAASFLGMWVVMMAAMMLPSLVPVLRRCRMAGRVGLGYFLVWAGLGLIVFVLGGAGAAMLTRLPGLAAAIPSAAGPVVLAAGLVQFTGWKRRHLAGCRMDTARLGTGWAQGIGLGWHCIASSAGLMAVLLTIGLMDLPVMALVTAAVTLERLAPDGATAARGVGVAMIGAALFI